MSKEDLYNLLLKKCPGFEDMNLKRIIDGINLYDQLRVRVAKLEKALKVYANKDNWSVFMAGSPFNIFGSKDASDEENDRPFLIAQEALKDE